MLDILYLIAMWAGAGLVGWWGAGRRLPILLCLVLYTPIALIITAIYLFLKGTVQ